MNYKKKFAPDTYVVDVLLHVKEMKPFGALSFPVPIPSSEKTQADHKLKEHFKETFTNPRGAALGTRLAVINISLSMVHDISTVRLYMPPDLRHAHSQMQLYVGVIDAQAEFPGSELPLLSATDLRLASSKTIQRIESLESRLASSPVHAMPTQRREELFKLYKAKQQLADKVKELKQNEKQSHILQFRTELANRLRVLRRLGHLNVDGVMQQKGKVAAEVESVDELLITELIFEGLFNDLEPAAVCALLICLFPMEKSRNATIVRSELTPGLAFLQKSARHVAEVQKECKIDINIEKYMSQFSTNLANITYDWCKGKSFPDVTSQTDMFEGSIIRLLRRLEELMRELVDAANAIGNGELAQKFEDGRKALKRGIVFAGSLYTE